MVVWEWCCYHRKHVCILCRPVPFLQLLLVVVDLNGSSHTWLLLVGSRLLFLLFCSVPKLILAVDVWKHADVLTLYVCNLFLLIQMIAILYKLNIKDWDDYIVDSYTHMALKRGLVKTTTLLWKHSPPITFIDNILASVYKNSTSSYMDSWFCGTMCVHCALLCSCESPVVHYEDSVCNATCLSHKFSI